MLSIRFKGVDLLIRTTYDMSASLTRGVHPIEVMSLVSYKGNDWDLNLLST